MPNFGQRQGPAATRKAERALPSPAGLASSFPGGCLGSLDGGRLRCQGRSTRCFCCRRRRHGRRGLTSASHPPGQLSAVASNLVPGAAIVAITRPVLAVRIAIACLLVFLAVDVAELSLGQAETHAVGASAYQ